MKDVIRFEDVDIEVIDTEGDQWVTVKNQGEALGYQDVRGFQKLVQEMQERGELKEGVHFRFIPLSGQQTKALSYRGVIRTAMRSDAPRAIQFRDWAEEVLFQVMVRGSYSMNPGCGRKLHWIDRLSPSERLELCKMRVDILRELQINPEDGHWFSMYLETYGGQASYMEWLEAKGEISEGWRANDLCREVKRLRTAIERMDNMLK